METFCSLCIWFSSNFLGIYSSKVSVDVKILQIFF